MLSYAMRNTSEDTDMNNGSGEINIVTEEDLILTDQGEACLFLRFKNCTGNVIKLSKADTETTIDPSEIT